MEKLKLISAALGVTVFAAGLLGFVGPHVAISQPASDQHDTHSASSPTAPRESAAFKLEVSAEAAAALRKAIGSQRETHPQDEQAPEHDLAFDYDDEIEAAKARGSNISANYLKICRDTPAGGVLLIPASMEENILDLCKVRDFEVRVSTIVWQPTIGSQSASSQTYSKNVPAQADSAAMCRAAATKRITHCEVQVSYCGGSLDCEKVTCNTNFTGCNDTWSGGPFEYYCDTGNSWNRDARFENVLAKACPTQ